MTLATLHFPRTEYTNRIARTRKEMAVRGLELLLVSDPSNMSWLTGYDGWSFYVHQGVLLSMEGDPIWWGRGMDAMGAKRTVMMDHDHIIGYEDTYVQNPDKHPMESLANLIKERGWENSSIGVELDNYYYSAQAHLALVEELPNASIGNATGLVNWQRAVKSNAEIEFMKRAARIVEKMHQTIFERAEPGVKKNELVADIYHAAIMGADGHWGDYPAIVPMAPSGMDATAPHLTWNDERLRKGECTFFEIAGVYRRYHCTQSRTLFLGQPPQKYLDAEKAVLEAVLVGLEQAKPGNHCEDIANAFNQTLNRLGFSKDSRCGYSIGLSYPPDWGERTMSFRRGDFTVLESGMTFHFMPALWLDDGGLEITEPILITDTGVECLCNTPRRLMVKK
ncbi:MAG: ectoine hydrolase DoeA [Gammaproteobacteria bacterium]|nr:ectoine hydrolase DoeA [Gammaproteobacteria bacterium]